MKSPFGQELKPGTILNGRFVIKKRLGEGGFSCVYLVLDRQNQLLRALKLLKDNEQDAVSRLALEANLMLRCAHPSVLACHDLLDIALPCGRVTKGLLMEFVVGKTLECIVGEINDLFPTPSELVRWFLGLVDVLILLEEKGVVHRDIKLANIMRCGLTGALKLLDFGIAFLESRNKRLTRVGVIVASPESLTPESLASRKEAPTPAMDRYAAGIVLFQLLSGGHMPFSCDNIHEACANHLLAKPTDIRTLRPDVSDELAAILSKLLDKSPKNRFSSASALKNALLCMLEAEERAALSAGAWNETDMREVPELALAEYAATRIEQPAYIPEQTASKGAHRTPRGESKAGKQIMYGMVAIMFSFLLMGGLLLWSTPKSFWELLPTGVPQVQETAQKPYKLSSPPSTTSQKERKAPTFVSLLPPAEPKTSR